MKKIAILCLAVGIIGSFFQLDAQTADVTFQVDMSVRMLEGKFNPATEVVTVPGDFNNWLNEPPLHTDKVMADPDGDSIYTKIISMLSNATYGYKYNIGLGWDGKDETTGNRSLVLGATDSVLAPVYFFNNDSVVNPPATKVSVTFKCNMRVKLLEAQFNPATQNLYVRGSFNGWSTANQMTDANADSIYDVKIDSLEIGSTVYFKYYWNNPDVWESDPNRSYLIPDQESEFIDYFDRDSVVTVISDGNILFTVDMSVMNEIGIYDPNVDKLQVRASFNGWSGSDTARSHMNQDFLDPNLWFLDVPFTQVPIGEMEYYKYYVVLQTPGIWTDGWERPCSRGGGNREVAFLGQPDQQAPPVYYDDIHPDWVIPSPYLQSMFRVNANGGVQAIFSVDMKPAMDPLKQAIPFDPALDTVYWIAEQPSFVRSQGWIDTDTMKVLRLTDPDGDLIFTGTLSIYTPSFNSFVYRYAYVSGTDGSWYHEPAGYGAFAYRVRFIGQDAARSFPVNPWAMPKDTWTNSEVKTDQETDPYTSFRFVQLPVVVQWNMISLPRIVSNPAKTYLFPTAISSAFEYGPSGYQKKDTLINGKGYWLKFGKDTTFTIIGDLIYNDSIDVMEGWNMIGGLTQSIPTVSITSDPPSIVTSNYFTYTGSYVIDDSLIAGKGYWVKTNQAGKLILHDCFNIPKSSSDNDHLASLPWINIRDSRGFDQTLYLARKSDNIQMNRYELPPVPPSDGFDVRLSSNRFIDIIDDSHNKELPVIVNSAKYPLK
ncbi:MAG: hypothetical protein HY800_08140, partial [Ignavibacteriales bacterium]|nr:hypothetical protein [Ignavibacteriales bacterium]